MVWRNPPVASVKFDVQEASPLVKIEFVKQNSTLFLQNNDPARIHSQTVFAQL